MLGQWKYVSVDTVDPAVSEAIRHWFLWTGLSNVVAEDFRLWFCRDFDPCSS